MEVSRRALQGRLAARALRGGTAAWLACAAALAFALTVALAQPITAPWWLYADADASYTASGLNLMAGKRTFYLDHPGMPLQDLTAITFEGRYLADRAFGTGTTRSAYRESRMRQIGESVAWWRAYAILFYLLGAAISFVVLMRSLGHWGWGLAGGLLWTGAPGLAPMAIQYRPDVLLGGLVLLSGYLIVRAAERRDAWAYVVASAMLGLTMSVKVHAAGAVGALAVALAWRPPGAGWGTRLRVALRQGLRRVRVPLAIGSALWIALLVGLNRGRLPPHASGEQHHLLMVLLGLFAVFLVGAAAIRELGSSRLGRRLLDPFFAVIAGALLLGVALPASLFPEDGLQMLVSMKEALTGGGVNQGVSAFDVSLRPFEHWPLQQAAVVFVIAGAAAVVGLLRREPWPVVWFVGGALLAGMASARLATTHYFAPAYVFSLPPALWLCRRLGRRAGVLAAVALSAYVVVPQVTHLRDPADRARRAERQAAAIAAIGDAVLEPHQAAVVDIGAPTAASRYNGYVEHFVQDPVPYPDRRFLEDYVRSADVAKAEGLQLRYYIGPRALAITAPTQLQLAWGTYTAVPVPAQQEPGLELGTLALVAGPGITYAYGHPDARYDPKTGSFRDPSGAYWTAWGEQKTGA